MSENDKPQIRNTASGQNDVLYTLISEGDKLFIHLAVGNGYQVFTKADNEESVRVNNLLADLIDAQAKREDARRKFRIVQAKA